MKAIVKCGLLMFFSEFVHTDSIKTKATQAYGVIISYSQFGGKEFTAAYQNLIFMRPLGSVG